VKIRIGKYDLFDTPKYISFLETDGGTALLHSVPVSEAGSYGQIAQHASDVKALLSTKTPENITIEYPEVPAGNPAFESREMYDVPTTGLYADEGRPIFPEMGKPWFKHCGSQYDKAKKPFTSSGSLAGIKTTCRNVAESATLLDYADFVKDMIRLVSTLADDVQKRYDEEKAKSKGRAERYEPFEGSFTVADLGGLLEQLGSAGFVQKITDLVADAGI
jgi:hypothetical protein